MMDEVNNDEMPHTSAPRLNKTAISEARGDPPPQMMMHTPQPPGYASLPTRMTTHTPHPPGHAVPPPHDAR